MRRILFLILIVFAGCQKENDEDKSERLAPIIENAYFQAGYGALTRGRPEFIHSGGTITVNEGQMAFFEATITGNPVPSVQWFKDGREISGIDSRISIGSQGSRYWLEILRTIPADQGTYMVVATNSYGITRLTFPGLYVKEKTRATE